jgi:peptide deformylase
MNLELVTYPHPALLRRTEPVAAIDDEVRQRAAQMLDLMHESQGVGLAAPQVAWSVKLLVLNPGDDRKDDRVLVNPRILRRRGKVLAEEGCLSFPGIFVQVERAQEIDVEFQDLEGATRVETHKEFLARIVQHEFDHLENVLLLHRMSPADRLRWKRDLESMVDRG